VWSKIQQRPSESASHTFKGQSQTTLFPGLTNFRHTSPCHRSNRDHGLQRGLLANRPRCMNKSTVTADPQVVKCNRFSYQQLIHILLHCKHHKRYSALDRPRSSETSELPGSIHSQSQYILIDRCINNSVQDTPAFPLVGAY